MSDIQKTKEKMTEEYEAKLVQDIMAMNLDGIETETAEVNKAFSKLALIFHWLRILDFDWCIFRISPQLLQSSMTKKTDTLIFPN